MSREEYVELLSDLKKSLQNSSFTKLNKVYREIDKTIMDLQKEKLEGIALPIRVQKLVYFINDCIAFDGMKLNSDQKKYWVKLRDNALAERNNDKRALGIFGSFIWH